MVLFLQLRLSPCLEVIQPRATLMQKKHPNISMGSKLEGSGEDKMLPLRPPAGLPVVFLSPVLVLVPVPEPEP